jgi:hypothetical protein
MKDIQKIKEVIINSLNEIGDASIQPYPFTSEEKIWQGEFRILFNFTTDKDIKYTAALLENYPSSKKEYEFSFRTEEYSFKDVINKGELFKVMSTIVAILKKSIDMLNSRGGWNKISFAPSKSFKGDERRANLYKSYILKNLPSDVKVKTGVNKITFINQNPTPIKEMKDIKKIQEFFSKRLQEEFNLSNYGTVTPPKGGASLVGKYNIIQGKSKYDTVIFDYQKGSNKPYGIVQVQGHGIYSNDLLKRLGLYQTKSWTAGVDTYIHDGNYTPIYISESDFKALLDLWSGGLDREAKAQTDFYRGRGKTSGTIDEASKDEETEFHKKLDKLVHNTFGKRKGELEEALVKKVISKIREAKSTPCWKGYEQKGMKEKNGKQVPNCVPKK